MTERTIQELAKEAGFAVIGEVILVRHSSGAWVGVNDELEKFAKLILQNSKDKS